MRAGRGFERLGEVVRLRAGKGAGEQGGRGAGAAPVALDVWLDDLENEYEVLVQRLRHVDRVLVKHGRKRRYLLPPK